MPRTAYCTIAARNYLPQVLALQESFKTHMPDGVFRLFLVDGTKEDVPDDASIDLITIDDLQIDVREYLDLATIYDVIEFSTAVKPLVFTALLETFENVIYLDPDMWVLQPLEELEDLLSQSPILLTPHFLKPIPPGSTYISEVHSLTVGIYNLGFCAFSRESKPFLDWWWSHLERECLIYPLLSIFVDQKWVDIGAELFHAEVLKDPGYNVGPWNLHERRICLGEDDSLCVNSAQHPLKVMHFSGFDPLHPETLSSRLGFSLEDLVEMDALRLLTETYARTVLRWRTALDDSDLSYVFGTDQSGRPMTRRIRRAYRKALLSDAHGLPSPFVAAHANRFKAWRRRTLGSRATDLFADASIALKYVFPDEISRMRSRFPVVASVARARLLRGSNVRR